MLRSAISLAAARKRWTSADVDGRSVKSCTLLALQAQGSKVKTIEGVAENGELHPMQAAFREHHGLQCGFCTPGMIMSSLDLVSRNPDPSEADVVGADGAEVTSVVFNGTPVAVTQTIAVSMTAWPSLPDADDPSRGGELPGLHVDPVVGRRWAATVDAQPAPPRAAEAVVAALLDAHHDDVAVDVGRYLVAALYDPRVRG